MKKEVSLLMAVDGVNSWSREMDTIKRNFFLNVFFVISKLVLLLIYNLKPKDFHEAWPL